MAAAVAGGALLTLDVVERQCLIDYFEDEDDLYWHHRLLLEPTPVPGVWVVATPDFDVERLDLNAHRVIALSRNSAFPAAHVPYLYPFDTPLAAATLSRLRQRGRDLLVILGVVAHGVLDRAAAFTWRVADTSSAAFGDVVPVAVVADPEQFMQPAVAGAEVYPVGFGLIDDCWLFCQGVTDEQVAGWRKEKVSAHGLDDRVTGDLRDADGLRFATFTQTVGKQVAPSKDAIRLVGQRCTGEFLTALRASGLEWLSHHLDFVRTSGVSLGSGVTRSHRRLSEALQCLQNEDQLNLPALKGAELLTRYLIQIETAVSRNPRAPDFQDLEAITGASVTATGALVLPEYNKFIAAQNRDEAFVLKQRRQWREEQDVIARSSGGGRSANQHDDGGHTDSGGGRGRARGARARGGGRGRAAEGAAPA
jgi:hypothetical protein